MSKETAWPSRTVQSQWKKTETSALRFTGTQHTPISTSALTHTTTGTQVGGWPKYYNIGPKKSPPQPRGQSRNRNTSKQHWATCGYPGGAFSKTSRKRDPNKVEDRNKRHSISILFLSGVLEKFSRILQKHDIPVQFNPSTTLRLRDWSTSRTKHQDTNIHTEPGGMQLL